jgi:hypothetical protein
MPFLQTQLNEYRLSPAERKQKQDLIQALQTLDSVVKELNTRVESQQPSLKSRELLQNSNRAVSVLRQFIDRKFEDQ